MKDTVIKGNGKSRVIKAPADMPATYEEWRSQAMAGNAFLDVSLNTNTAGENAGCTVIGTPQCKSTLLDDNTKAALELEQSDPNVNDALYALSQKSQPAVLNVHTNAGTVVTATKGSTVLSATANSDGLAVLYPNAFGVWTLKATIDGKTLTVPFTINAIAVFDLSMTTDLEAASWNLISTIAEAGTANTVWNIGDRKNITVGGTVYPAQIIGFNHDDKVGGGKAGITFQLVDCLNEKGQMETSNTNANGWGGCAMKAKMTQLRDGLEPSLKNAIKTVKKLTSAGNQSATIKTTNDDLFLLSEVEIFGATTYSKPGEGSQYAWYQAGNSRVKKVNGSADNWWERSPNATNTTAFCRVYTNGDANVLAASYSYGVSFGFCV